MNILKKLGLKNKESVEELTLEDTYDVNDTILTKLSPDSIIEKEDYVQLGDNYTKTYAISALKSQIEADDLREINEFNENINMSLFYSEIDNSKIKKNYLKVLVKTHRK